MIFVLEELDQNLRHISSVKLLNSERESYSSYWNDTLYFARGTYITAFWLWTIKLTIYLKILTQNKGYLQRRSHFKHHASDSWGTRVWIPKYKDIIQEDRLYIREWRWDEPENNHGQKEIFRGFNFCPNSTSPCRVMVMFFTGLESWRQGWGRKTQNNQKKAKVNTFTKEQVKKPSCKIAQESRST